MNSVLQQSNLWLNFDKILTLVTAQYVATRLFAHALCFTSKPAGFIFTQPHTGHVTCVPASRRMRLQSTRSSKMRLHFLMATTCLQSKGPCLPEARHTKTGHPRSKTWCCLSPLLSSMASQTLPYDPDPMSSVTWQTEKLSRGDRGRVQRHCHREERCLHTECQGLIAGRQLPAFAWMPDIRT